MADNLSAPEDLRTEAKEVLVQHVDSVARLMNWCAVIAVANLFFLVQFAAPGVSLSRVFGFKFTIVSLLSIFGYRALNVAVWQQRRNMPQGVTAAVLVEHIQSIAHLERWKEHFLSVFGVFFILMGGTTAILIWGWVLN